MKCGGRRAHSVVAKKFESLFYFGSNMSPHEGILVDKSRLVGAALFVAMCQHPFVMLLQHVCIFGHFAWLVGMR